MNFLSWFWFPVFTLRWTRSLQLKTLSVVFWSAWPFTFAEKRWSVKRTEAAVCGDLSPADHVTLIKMLLSYLLGESSLLPDITSCGQDQQGQQQQLQRAQHACSSDRPPPLPLHAFISSSSSSQISSRSGGSWPRCLQPVLSAATNHRAETERQRRGKSRQREEEMKQLSASESRSGGSDLGRGSDCDPPHRCCFWRHIMSSVCWTPVSREIGSSFLTFNHQKAALTKLQTPTKRHIRANVDRKKWRIKFPPKKEEIFKLISEIDSIKLQNFLGDIWRKRNA